MKTNLHIRRALWLTLLSLLLTLGYLYFSVGLKSSTYQFNPSEWQLTRRSFICGIQVSDTNEKLPALSKIANELKIYPSGIGFSFTGKSIPYQHSRDTEGRMWNDLITIDMLISSVGAPLQIEQLYVRLCNALTDGNAFEVNVIATEVLNKAGKP